MQQYYNFENITTSIIKVPIASDGNPYNISIEGTYRNQSSVIFKDSLNLNYPSFFKYPAAKFKVRAYKGIYTSDEQDRVALHAEQ
jgi:hypothetical protein